MASTPSHHVSDSPPSPKRRRVALACRNCRERKVRCDAVRPICGTCQRRGKTEEPCEYLVIAETAKFQTERAYIQSLRDHIVELENSARQPSTPLDLAPGENTAFQMVNSPVPPVISTPSEHPRVSHRHQEHCEHYPSPGATTLPSSISAMGAPVADIREADIRDQYFGHTSIVSLVQECAHTSPRQHRTVTQAFTPSADSPASCNVSCGGTRVSSLLSDDYSLPPRKTADWLLSIYFNSSHLFYPWVHKDSFLASYSYIWSPQDDRTLKDLPDVGLGGRNCPTSVFYCALNAILAIACEFSNLPSQEKRTTSLMFYERMKGLVNIDIFDSGSLAHVQALLLVAMYLQCTAYPKRCWNIVGMAYRMSTGLGLHLSRHARDLTRLEREMRWRTWCACVHMDIIVSMTMGRPAMTSSPDNVPLPSATDDRYLAMADEVDQPPGQVSPNQFMHENMRLIQILSKILARIYHSTEPIPEPAALRRPDVDLQAIVDIDRDFDDFEASLHSAFQWTTRDPIDPGSKRQSNVLHARFLHLRLLLYRPAFSEYCLAMTSPECASSNRGQRWSILCRANCATGCVQAACDLIESLATATIQYATGAWWYGVFYLISAGIILLLADSSQAPFDGIDREHRNTAWNRCIETLHRMVEVHPSARDYAIALSGLKEQQQSTTNAGPPEGQGQHYDLNGMAWNGQPERQAATLKNDLNAPYNILDPLVSHWDNGIEDIMLPAQFLQEMDGGLLLPSLF
ncbi:fungal-specific transcription factor domain-containing protein [Aspergillus cavernicola]|uniref:Fungal-specific transcription factor domain-containing protein n=1 Tax=Aspergillus cavernicola TaxID=176166 RepID=A0ABR4I8J5_9EURO